MILLAAVFGMSLAAPNPGYLYGLHGYGHSSHHYPSIHRVYLGMVIAATTADTMAATGIMEAMDMVILYGDPNNNVISISVYYNIFI